MEEISDRDDFLPEATWLAAYVGDGREPIEYCGTIQGIRVSSRLGGIQNVGITPPHRGRGVGLRADCRRAGRLSTGRPAAGLSGSDRQNEPAVRLYRQLGFRRTKTLYKAVEFAYS